MENRQFEFQVKSALDTGTFRGRASVFDNVDLIGDRMARGAFSKTIRENGGKVPLLLEHRDPIGVGFVSEGSTGLDVRGVLNLEKNLALETLSDLKFYQDSGMPMGMSFGFSVIKSDREGGVRVIKEVRLYEVSITMSPANPAARVQAVKKVLEGAEILDQFKREFTTLLKQARVESQFADLVKSVQAKRR